MKLIYLDIDGVLNDHQAYTNGYCGTSLNCIAAMNCILDEEPEAKLVISSAWRYLVLTGSMTLKGFEALLLTHGLKCHGRIHSTTVGDEAFAPSGEWWQDPLVGIDIRAKQIESHILIHRPTASVVIDDLPIPIDQLVRTNSETGLTMENVAAVMGWLR